MKNIYVSNEQLDKLDKVYQSMLGLPDWYKYRCALYFKSEKTGNWKFSIYVTPALFKKYYTGKSYFKIIRGEIYIYREDGKERILLNDACKKILNIA